MLQEKQFNRLGGNDALSVDVRVVAATHRNLQEMVREGNFREDLFYRLNVFPILIPPLRERLDDIPLLAEHLLTKHQALARHAVKGFSPSAIHDMMNYEWHGNIRELENLIKRAIITAEGETIASLELAKTGGEDATGDALDAPATTGLAYKEYLDKILRDAEHKYLLRILKECKGNLNQVARMMDVDRKTVYRKIEEYKIEVARFKS